MIKIERTFWPVGQGAFYSELFYEEGKPNGLVVYDCGTLSSQKYIKTSIKVLRQKFDNSSICKNGGIDIDILFVSHFHYDHISGITQLLKVFNIKKIVLPVIPQEAYADVYLNNYINERHEGKPTIELLENFLSDDNNINNTQLLRFADLDLNGFYSKGFNVLNVDDSNSDFILSKTILKLKDWNYIPYNYPCEQSFELYKRMKKDYPELLENIEKREWDKSKTIIEKIGIKQIKKLYVDAYSKDQNEESMTVLSCPSHESNISEEYCLYTGDSPFRNPNRLSVVKIFYKDYWYKIGIIQSPHHGAECDNPDCLHDSPRTSVVCYGTNNRYGHPCSKIKIDMIINMSKFVLVTEANKYTQDLCVDYVHEI